MVQATNVANDRSLYLVAGFASLLGGVALLTWHLRSRDSQFVVKSARQPASFSRPDVEDDVQGLLHTPRTPAILNYAPVNPPGIISVGMANGSYNEDRSGVRRGSQWPQR